MRTRTLRNASWLTIGRLAGDAASLLLFVILSRTFGLSGIGQYSFGFAIAGILYSLVNFGLQEYGIRECAHLAAETKRRLLGDLLTIQGVLFVLGLLLLVGFLFGIHADEETFAIVLLLTFSQTALAFADSLFVPAFAAEKMAGPAIATLLCRLAGMVATAALVMVLHTSLAVALLPLAIASAALVGASLVSAVHHLPGMPIRTTWTRTRSLLKPLWPFAASVVVSKIDDRVAVIMLALMLGDHAAGIYSTGLKFLDVGILPIAYLAFASYPNMSRAFGSRDGNLVEVVIAPVRSALILSALLAWALFFLAPPLVGPLFGDAFTEAIPVVQAMAAWATLSTVRIHGYYLLAAMNLQGQRLAIGIAAALLNVILLAVLIPWLEIAGALIAWMLTSIAIAGAYLKLLHGRPVGSSLTHVGAAFVACMLIAAAVTALLMWYETSVWIVCACALVTLTLMLWFTGLSRSILHGLPWQVKEGSAGVLISEEGLLSSSSDSGAPRKEQFDATR